MKNLILSDVIVGDGARDVKVEFVINAVVIDKKMFIKHVNVSLDKGLNTAKTIVKCDTLSSAVEYMDEAIASM